MATANIVVEVRVAWWFKVYAAGTVLFSELFGLEPDPKKIEFLAKKAISIGKPVAIKNADK